MLVNIATIVLAVSTALLGVDVIKENPQLVAILSGTLIPFANIVLRMFTTEPVSKKKKLF
jgi:hypothetical protein